MLEIEVEEADGYTLCRPVGELDASSVPFMDSAGLGALIGGIRRAREAGGDVAVACSRSTLTRLLHTTGFDRIVPVTETLDGAAKALVDPRANGG